MVSELKLYFLLDNVMPPGEADNRLRGSMRPASLPFSLLYTPCLHLHGHFARLLIALLPTSLVFPHVD